MDIRIDEDTSSVVGGVPPIGADAIMWAASLVRTLPGSSYLTVAYPFAFSGIKSIVCSPGDIAGGLLNTVADAPNQTLTTLNVRCTNSADAGIGGQTVRVNVIVIGW